MKNLTELLHVDGSVFQALSTIADMILLNILFVICSLPIVTMGPALSALSGVMQKIKDGEEGYAWKTFLALFMRNFKAAFLLWLAMLPAGGIIIFDLYLYRGRTGGMMSVLRILLFAGLFLWLLLLITLFSYQGRYGTGIKESLRGAVLLLMMNAPKSLLMVCLIIFALTISLLTTATLAVLGAFWLLIGFSLLGWINATLQMKTFAVMDER